MSGNRVTLGRLAVSDNRCTGNGYPVLAHEADEVRKGLRRAQCPTCCGPMLPVSVEDGEHTGRLLWVCERDINAAAPA